MDSHIKDSKLLHEARKDYGNALAYEMKNSMKNHFQIPEAINEMNKKFKNINSVLDYGTGKGGLLKTLQKRLDRPIKIQGYDPAVEKFEAQPKGTYDLVTCIDVLEHIDRRSIDRVLEDISKYTDGIFFYSIDLIPARKKLIDGRNAHILLAPADWWCQKLASHFIMNLNFRMGRNKDSSRFPVRLIGCSTNNLKNFSMASNFLKFTRLPKKEIIHLSNGIEFKVIDIKYKENT